MAPPLLATCPVCKRTVSTSKVGTISAHGTPGERCPGGGTRVGAVIEMLEEVKRMKRRRKP